MKPKLLVVVAILVALAAVTAKIRTGTNSVPSTPPAAAKKAAAPDLNAHPALASYRVFEEPAAEGALPFRGANYTAEVSPDGLRFEAGEHRISLRARRIEQGGAALELSNGTPVKTRFAATSIPRAEGVAEEFVFENRRAEHLVRLDRPVGEGAVVVRVAVESNLGQVQQVRRGDASWKDSAVADGGLIFMDESGQPALAYHGAVAIDAEGRRQHFNPRWENGEICLEVPAAFMKDAAYPVLIDPWLELDFSASGGGLSLSGSVSETPAIALISGNSPCVAWSDASDGDFDIYFRYWTGTSWTALGTSASPGGVSANAGTSVKPSIGFFTPTNTTFTHPFIAWEDDQIPGTGATVNVYAKFWTGTAWVALGGSATTSGISLSIGTPCRNPQAVGVAGLVQTDPLGTLPFRSEQFPCVVWEEEGVGIASRFFYPGDNRLQAPVAGWYAHPSGLYVTLDTSASRPTVVIDSSNQLSVAWQASSGTEFDIFAARSTASTRYVVAAVTAVPGPTSSWASLGTASPGLGALSIQPSLAVDFNDTLWVAWQETVGTEREIYVAFNTGGVWSGIGNSNTGQGVSRTSLLGAATNSSFPSITVHPNDPIVRPVVAWEDDVSGNTEIYVRRLNPTGNTWDQIADEGSASMAGLEVTGNTGGVSRTPGFSLQPKAVVGPDRSVSVAWRDASTGSFDVYVRRYFDNAPTNLGQAALTAGVATPLAPGATSTSVDLRFTALLFAESSTTPIKLHLQLEVAPATAGFSDDIILESAEVDDGTTATIDFTGLPNVNYHWRARSVDTAGRVSPWVSFGSSAVGTVDFRVDSNAVGAGGSNNAQGTSTEHKDKCGLAGLEALALIGLAALARRRRKA